jgi:hypothetical protein
LNLPLYGTGEDIDRRQALVRPLLDWACAGGKLDERHPNYVRVTQGRDTSPGYSSCGDLAHWLLFTLGCRQPWVNRAGHGKGWRVGMNVSLLCYPEGPLRRVPAAGSIFESGDILVSWSRPDTTDSHVMVCHDFDAEPLRLVVGEFGAPGGQIADKNISARDGSYYLKGKYGTKRLMRWLPLHLVLTDAAERSELVEVELPWEDVA